jgi:hypothetical protein
MGARIPTIDTCDQSDPKQKYQWAFADWPYLGTQGYTPAEEIRETYSERLDALAFVHAPALAALADENGNIHVSQLPEMKLKLRMPYRGQQHATNGLLKWVDLDDEDPEPVMIQDPAELTVHEQMVQVERLRFTGAIKDPEPEVVAAQVVNRPLFDPSEHTPSYVNGYLAGQSELEIRRVIAAEMCGKARDQILRKHKGV